MMGLDVIFHRQDQSNGYITVSDAYWGAKSIVKKELYGLIITAHCVT